jgi:hypothetical protein
LPSSQSTTETAIGSREQGSKKKGSKKKEAIIMSGRSQGNSSSSGGSGGSYRASPRDRFAEVDYSNDFFGNSRYGLYYDIIGERRPVPSLEVESDDDWRIRGQFCDIKYNGGVQGGSRKVCKMSTTEYAGILNVIR